MQTPQLKTYTSGIIDEIQVIDPFENQAKKDLDAVVRDFGTDRNSLTVIHEFAHGIELWAEQWPLKSNDHSRMMAFYLVKDHMPIGQFLLDYTTVQNLSSDETVLRWHHAFVVSYAYIDQHYRTLYPGLGYKVYEYLLNHNVVLVSDIDHTVMSKRVWEKLLHHYYMYVYEHRHLESVHDTAAAYENRHTRLVASNKPLD